MTAQAPQPTPSGQSAPVKVLHLITELSSGGAQSALLRLLKGLDRTRFTPSVVCLYNGDDVVAQQIRALGIAVTDLQMRGKQQLGAFGQLYRLLRQQRPAILHTWMFHANFPGRIVGRLAGVPIIITSRRNVEIGGANRDRLQRWTAGLDDRVIAVCELARQAEIERAGARPAKVVTIYNGLELAEFPQATPETRQATRQTLGIAEDVLLLGSVGRLHRQKGFTHLLAALPTIKAQFPQVKLLLVGDGELCDALEAQTAELGLQESVIFTGTRTDVPTLLTALDLFVLPSLWEGLPNVILEAMAVGLPVVATAVGGTPELVVDGSTGCLVPPSNPAALAKAIGDLLAQPAQRQQMGAAGRVRVEQQFTIQRMVQATEALYGRLLVDKGVK